MASLLPCDTYLEICTLFAVLSYLSFLMTDLMSGAAEPHVTAPLGHMERGNRGLGFDKDGQTLSDPHSIKVHTSRTCFQLVSLLSPRIHIFSVSAYTCILNQKHPQLELSEHTFKGHF